MRKVIPTFILIYCSSILLVQHASGQRISPLFQIMSANPLVARPSEFRTLQDDIVKVIGETKPGMQVDALYKKITKSRADLMNRLPKLVLVRTSKLDNSNPPKEIGSTLKISLNIRSKEVKNSKEEILYEFELNAKPHTEITTINQIFNNLEIKLTGEINLYINQYLGPAINNTQLNAALKAAFVSAMQELINENKVITSENISNILARSITEKLKETAVNLLQEIDNSIDGNTTITLANINGIANELIKASNELNNNTTRLFSDALDRAEQEVYKAVDEFSKQLISSNIGVGVTDGQGALAGGVHFSYNSASFQAGIYANGELSPQDTSRKNDTTITQPTRSLIGVNARFIVNEDFQIDLLASILFGDGKYKALQTAEFGAGVSCNPINSKVVIGFGIFGLIPFAEEENNLSRKNVYSVGVTIKGTEATAPSLLFGFSIQTHGNIKPAFQISFPLLSKK